MCGPALVAPLAIASAVVSAGGQLYSGLSQNASAKYEARVANQNRDIELRSRDDAMARGEIEQMRLWRATAQKYGEQRARQAASGVDVSFGSALDLTEDVMMIDYEDSGILAENTKREVQGYDINAANYTMQARAARARGKAAVIGAGISGLSTILGAASQVSKSATTRATAMGG